MRHLFVLVPLMVSCVAQTGQASPLAPEVLSVRSDGAIPFDVYVARPDGALVMPPPPSDLSNRPINAAGVPTILIGGNSYFHIADISAMASGMSNNSLEIAAHAANNPKLTPSNLKALDWLQDNKEEIEDGGVVWKYTFNHSFNNLRILGPWASSYAQADVIKALLLANTRSGDARYTALALRAAYAFTVPCERGGVRCVVGGVPWFEEVPLAHGYAPMILNGHLYSVAMLHRLWEVTGDERVKAAFNEGVASAKAMLLRYDTGYWTTYQIRPRTIGLDILIAAGDDTIEAREIEVRSSFSSSSKLIFSSEMVKTYSGNSFGGEGVALTQSGLTVKGTALVHLEPGRLSVGHDPVNFAGFDISFRYQAPRCESVRLGGLDWRQNGKLNMEIPGQQVSRVEDECLISARLPSNANQWSHTLASYHNWHTRLVTDLWRITQDPKFYAAAVRWRQYEAAYKRPAEANEQLLTASFEPTDDGEADAALFAALGGQPPEGLTEGTIRDGIQAWATSTEAPPALRSALMTRAGLRP